jgi:hypothetical protein
LFLSLPRLSFLMERFDPTPQDLPVIPELLDLGIEESADPEVSHLPPGFAQQDKAAEQPLANEYGLRIFAVFRCGEHGRRNLLPGVPRLCDQRLACDQFAHQACGAWRALGTEVERTGRIGAGRQRLGVQDALDRLGNPGSREQVLGFGGSRQAGVGSELGVQQDEHQLQAVDAGRGCLEPHGDLVLGDALQNL